MEEKEACLVSLDVQYTFLGNHLQYHDANVLKIISIFFGFSGLYIANIDRFAETPSISSALVLIVGVIFALLLYRTSCLLTDLKQRLIDIENQKQKLYGDYFNVTSISDQYIANKLEIKSFIDFVTKLRTSTISVYSVLAFSIILALATIAK